jgi:hypothetical protein
MPIAMTMAPDGVGEDTRFRKMELKVRQSTRRRRNWISAGQAVREDENMVQPIKNARTINVPTRAGFFRAPASICYPPFQV